MSGTLLAIARRPASRAPMEIVERGLVSVESGLEGDCKGRRFPRRQITVLAQEDWRAACASLSPPTELEWWLRRANLLVAGLRLPRGAGSRLAIGGIEIEVTAQTYPCRRMEEAHPGLLKALAPDWRGGVTCRVLTPGAIAVGDAVRITCALPEHVPRLPG